MITILPHEQQIQLIEEKFQEIFSILGVQCEGSPHRIAKMYVEELFYGLREENFPQLMFVEDPAIERGQRVLVKEITIRSICEHHFVPMVGKAKIAYLVGSKTIGLSKIHRIAHYFAARPQLQERLGTQIADCLQEVLETDHVAVSLTLQHFCIFMRGVKEEESVTETQILRGAFTESPYRQEFLIS